jgi:hypothetical protein
MNDTTPKSYLELDDEPVKVAPNKDVFKPVSSLQVREGAVAKQDAQGNWYNAIGLQSTEEHRHVAKVWQDKCIPFPKLIESVNEQAKFKRDIVKKESEIRLQDADTLVDGTPLNDSGLNSLRMFSGIPSSMISFLDERGYQNDLVKFVNTELDRREETWNASGKEPRSFRVRVRHDDDGNDVIRAIVSERYGVIDNHEALEMIANSLSSLKGSLASHVTNDGDDIFGNVLLPDYMKSEPDSDYGVGISFRNSEIRNATFKISPFLFRAICLNGMIWGRQDSSIQINQRHMGRINTQELQAQVRNVIQVALTQGNDMLTLLGYSKQVKVDNVLPVIAQFCRDQKMTIEQGKLWHKGYLETLQESKGDVAEKTAFGIVNGLTRSAQSYDGFQREQMETTASLILAPAIDASLQEMSKRWGQMSDRASILGEETVMQYAFVG